MQLLKSNVRIEKAKADPDGVRRQKLQQLRVDRVAGRVRLTFGQPITWVDMRPDDAVALANALLTQVALVGGVK